MKTKITFLKTMLFTLTISASITLQAQTPILEMKFENNLDATGGFTFETSDSSTAPFSSVVFAEGSNALYFSNIADDTDPAYPLIDNTSSAQISSTTNLGITGNSARTVSAWIRYDDILDTTNGSHCIVNIGDPSSATQGRNTFTFAAANNLLTVAIGGGNVNHNYSGDPAVLEDGDWHHVAFTLAAGGDMSAITFYIDGFPVTSDGGNNSNAINTTDDLVYIGTRGNNSQKWFDGGGIDDLRIYDSSLTDAQILAVFNETALSTTDFAFGELKAYPNAVKDILHITTTSNNSLDISLFDISGKILIRTIGKYLDMSNLSSGMYIVKVREDNKVANLKILKK